MASAKDVKAKQPTVHLCDEAADPLRGLCGARLEGVDHPRGEENCVRCIVLWAARLVRMSATH